MLTKLELRAYRHHKRQHIAEMNAVALEHGFRGINLYGHQMKWAEELSDKTRINLILESKQLIYPNVIYVDIINSYINSWWHVDTISYPIRNIDDEAVVESLNHAIQDNGARSRIIMRQPTDELIDLAQEFGTNEIWLTEKSKYNPLSHKNVGFSVKSPQNICPNDAFGIMPINN
mgnify:CR=1 FL=1